MGLGSILTLALALSMDTAAVSLACGLKLLRVRPRHVALIALSFGGFHVAMPLVGYALGSLVGGPLASVGHWVSFAIFVALGVKMLWEAAGHGHADEAEACEDAPGEARDPLSPHVVLALGVGTSLDAMAAGITLPFLAAPLALTVLTIGLTAGTMSALGLLLGHRLGALFERRLDLVGGIALIALGVRVLVESLFFS